MRPETEKFLKLKQGVKEVNDMLAFYDTDEGRKRNLGFRQRTFAKQTREAHLNRKLQGRMNNMVVSGGGCTSK
jgi:hypothetical protein